MNIDYTIFKTKEQFVKLINESGLAPSIINYILREISSQLESIANNNISNEIQNEKKEEAGEPLEKEE